MPDTPDPNGSSEATEGRHARMAEDVFVILCILSLWPAIFHWRSPFWEYVLYAALAGLVVIFVRRVRRFRQARDELNA